MVIDKAKERLNAWNSLFLSPSRRLILINFVLKSIGTYCFSTFKFPVSVLDKLQSIISRFRGLGAKKETGIHWRSWQFITKPKNEGGLGIKDPRMFNKALLAKK